MSDFRSLISRMADELDHYRQLLMDNCRATHALATEARAALAAEEPAVPEGREPASVTGEPGDNDLDLLVIAIQALRPAPDLSRHDLEAVDKGREILRKWLARFDHHSPDATKMVSQPAPPAEGEVALQRPESFEFALDFLGDPEASELRAYIDQLEARAVLAADGPAVPTERQLLQLAAEYWPEGCEPAQATRFARAALARWGRQPAPPVAGEVGELVAKLRRLAPQNPLGTADPTITRAADLLEQRHPAPVPVTEKLPGPEDCDAEGGCWLLTVEDEYPQWRLHSIEGSQPGGSTMIWVPVDSSPGVMVDAFYTSHWLPFHALPLPQGESQP